jgi:undecaprenyl-diphosphatase
MDQILDNLRLLDRKGFFYLTGLAGESAFWHDFFYFFARYGIVLIVLSLIYLVLRHRFNALFSAALSIILSNIISFIIYLLWQRPRPFITYADVTPIVGQVTAYSFPSVHTYMSFAIAITITLYGHKKLGALLILIAILTAISRVGGGIHYPSDVITGTLIGIFSGVLTYWFIESFENFWQEYSVK